MTTKATWRDVIHRYLDACQEDQRVSIRLETQTYRMLMSLGSKRLIRAVFESRSQRNKLAEQPLASVEHYTLIEDRPTFVVAEVDGCKGGQPRFRSRFRIGNEEGKWVLDDVYWACHCKEGRCLSCHDGKCTHCSEGRCSICNGQGAYRRWGLFTHSCVLCQGSGSCFCCRGTGSCFLCDGLGRCTSCAYSDMPGWTSIYGTQTSEPQRDA